VEVLLARYELYEPWIGDRIEERRIAWLRKVTRRPRWQASLIDFFWFRIVPAAVSMAGLILFLALLSGLGLF
jgi:hypothetical protein